MKIRTRENPVSQSVNLSVTSRSMAAECCLLCTVHCDHMCCLYSTVHLYTDNSTGVQRSVYTQAAASLRTSSVQRSVLLLSPSQGVAVAELSHSVIRDPGVSDTDVVTHGGDHYVMCDTLTQ